MEELSNLYLTVAHGEPTLKQCIKLLKEEFAKGKDITHPKMPESNRKIHPSIFTGTVRALESPKEIEKYFKALTKIEKKIIKKHLLEGINTQISYRHKRYGISIDDLAEECAYNTLGCILKDHFQSYRGKEIRENWYFALPLLKRTPLYRGV